MINVLTLRPHGNPRGPKWWKLPGDVYSLTDSEAAALVADDLVFAEFPMSQVDNFNGVAGDVLIGSSVNPYALTPHDTDPLPIVPKAIYVGTAGDVVLRGIGADQDVTFRNVMAGFMIVVRASHVRATGTTATDLVALA